MLDQKTVINYVNEYAKAVLNAFSPAAILLYGSYAKGTAHEDSDIDVAVIFDRFDGDRLKISARLWGLTEDVSSYIEPVLLDRSHDPSGFVDEIYKTGKLIYSA